MPFPRIELLKLRKRYKCEFFSSRRKYKIKTQKEIQYSLVLLQWSSRDVSGDLKPSDTAGRNDRQYWTRNISIKVYRLVNNNANHKFSHVLKICDQWWIIGLSKFFWNSFALFTIRWELYRFDPRTSKSLTRKLRTEEPNWQQPKSTKSKDSSNIFNTCQKCPSLLCFCSTIVLLTITILDVIFTLCFA